MTTAFGRRRVLGAHHLRRRQFSLFGRPAARPHVLHATNDVGVLLSLLAAEDEPDASEFVPS
jgi:hypothetical protein